MHNHTISILYIKYDAKFRKGVHKYFLHYIQFPQMYIKPDENPVITLL
jgi:hypothetical protein